MFQKIFYGWWIVLACFFISLYVSCVIFYSFTAFFEPIANEFGWSYTQISFASSLRGLEMGLLAPLIGYLVDRFGSRKLILCGVITIGFGLLFLSYTRSLPMFYFSFLFIAFGAGGCTSVVSMTAVTNWFSKNVGKALGVMSAGFGASGLLIPLVVWLVDAYEWRTALIILGFGMWIIGIPLSLVIRNRPQQYGYLPDSELPENQSFQSEISGKGVEITFKEAFKKRSFLYLNLSEAIRFLLLSSVVIHIMPYLSTMGISRSTAGLVAAGIPLFSILGRFGFGWLSDIFDKRYVIAIAFSFMGMGTLALCYVQESWFIYLFLLFFAPGYGGIAVTRGAILREYFGTNFFGKMIGIMMGIGSIGGIIGPTLTGWVFDTFGTYHVIWFVFSGFICLAILMILRIKPE